MEIKQYGCTQEEKIESKRNHRHAVWKGKAALAAEKACLLENPF